MHVYIIGVGGIGQRLLDDVPQMVACNDDGLFGRDKPTLVLVDGDSFEDKNLSRQKCVPSWIGKNKASCFADLVSRRFPEINVLSHPCYITPDNVGEILDVSNSFGAYEIYILMAVDSYKTRKVVNDHVRKMRGNISLISGGNEMTDGSVMVYRKDSSWNPHRGAHESDITAPLDAYHDEIKFPPDKYKYDMSCDELANVDPQIIPMNRAISTSMLITFWDCVRRTRRRRPLDGQLPYGEVYVDISTHKFVPVERKPVQ